jgi:starch synthase
MAKIAKSAKLNIVYATTLPFPFEGECSLEASLPRALALKGANAVVIAPLYKEIAPLIKGGLKFLFNVEAYMLLSKRCGGVYSYSRDGVEHYFIENDYYFNRKGYRGHYDDGERFAFFCRAAIECAKRLFGSCVIHCCDNFSALIPIYLRCGQDDIKTVLSLGDISRQGKYSRDIMESSLAIPEQCFDMVEYEGDVNVLKGAILTADAVVAPNGCRAEFLSKEGNWELAGLFKDIKLLSVLCGTGYDGKGGEKAEVKAALVKQFKFGGEAPLIAYAGEFDRESGADLVADVLPEILNLNVNFVALGRGEKNEFYEFAEKYKSNFKAIFCDDKSFEDNLLRAADIALYPHKPQACIEGALNLLARGCICVGDKSTLKDIIKDGVNGFLFSSRDGYQLTVKIKQAVNAYDDKKTWHGLVSNAVGGKFTWDNTAREYLKIYKGLI